MKFNYYRFSIKCINASKLLYSLNNKDIKIYNILYSNKILKFDIKYNNKNQLINILEKEKLEYEIINYQDLKKISLLLLNKVGIFIGLIVVSMYLLIANMVTWKINIVGNKKVPNIEIMQILKKHNIEIGSFENNFILAEEELRTNSNIADAYIKKDGIVTYVKIFEKGDTTSIDDPNNIPLISAYDAQITQIILHCGTSLVKIGDMVSKGKELIAPYILSTTGEKLRDSAADGEVYGTVVFNASEYISLKEIKFEQTGVKKSYSQLNFMNYGEKEHKSPFKYYIKESKVNFLSPFPLKITSTTYYELKAIKKEITLEAAKEKVKKDILDRLILKAGGKVNSVDLNVIDNGNENYKITVIINATMQIAKKMN